MIPFPFQVDHYSIETGLNHDAFLQGIQDMYGQIYFGSWGKGLFRYNGSDWSHFDADRGHLLGNTVMDMAYDGEQTLFLAHMDSGISVFHIVTGEARSLVDADFFDSEITRLHIDGNLLYICSMKGLWIYDLSREEIRYYPLVTSNSEYRQWQWQLIRSIFKDNRGRILLGSRYGIVFFNEKITETRYCPFASGQDMEIYQLAEVDGRILVFCRNFVGVLDEEAGVIRESPYPALNRFAEQNPLPDQTPFARDSAGRLFLMSMSRGGIVYDPGVDHSFYLNQENQFLRNNFVNGLFVDREENIWIMTRGGLEKLHLSQFDAYTTLGGLEMVGCNIDSSTEHQLRQGESLSWLYFPEDKKAVLLKKDRFFIQDLVPFQTGNSRLTHIFEHEGRTIFRFQRKGAASIRYYQWQEQGLDPLPPVTSSANSLEQDGWIYRFTANISGHYMAVEREDPLTGKKESFSIHLWERAPEPFKVRLYSQGGGKILLLYHGSRDSTVLFDSKKKEARVFYFRKLIQDVEKKEIIIKDIQPDRQGGFWISLAKPQGSVYHYCHGKLENFTDKIRTRDLFIENIKVNSRGQLFIATSSDGLIRYDGNTLTTYSRESGLRYGRLAGGIQIDEDDTVYALLGPVIAVLKENRMPEPKLDLSFYKAENLAAKKERFLFNTIEPVFQPSWRSLSFCAAPNSYFMEGKMEYRFLLKDIYKEWTSWSQKHFIQLPELKPGAYQLAAEVRDVWGRKDARAIRFHISSYWYETLFFKISFFLLMIGLLWGLLVLGVKLYTRTLTRRAQLLEQSVDQRTKELKEAQQKLVDHAYDAGRAELATGVLHNVGNILNSINISRDQLRQILNTTSLPGLMKANELLLVNRNNLEYFLSADERGRVLVDYYKALGEQLNVEQEQLKGEVDNLFQKTLFMETTISKQQEYAIAGMLVEPLDLVKVAEDVITLFRPSLQKNKISVEKEFKEGERVMLPLQKAKILHVLHNLFMNAKESLVEKGGEAKRITMEIYRREGQIVLAIRDNGLGIRKENLKNIFSLGFSTKVHGHGYGLHSCANFMSEMKGLLKVESPGEGKGAVFLLIWPEEMELKHSVPRVPY